MSTIFSLFETNTQYEEDIDDRGGGVGPQNAPLVSYKVIPITNNDTVVPQYSKHPYWRVIKSTGRDFAYKSNYAQFLSGNLNGQPIGPTNWPKYDYVAYVDLSGLDLSKLRFSFTMDVVFLMPDFMFMNGVQIWTGAKPTNGGIHIETFADGTLKTYLSGTAPPINTTVPNMLINGVNTIMFKLSLLKIVTSGTTIKP